MHNLFLEIIHKIISQIKQQITNSVKQVLSQYIPSITISFPTLSNFQNIHFPTERDTLINCFTLIDADYKKNNLPHSLTYKSKFPQGLHAIKSLQQSANSIQM